jgi:hypothetical protein
MKTFVLFFFFFLSSQAKEFHCELNIAPPQTVVKANEVEKFVKKMTFDTFQSRGKSLTLDNIKVSLWNKNGHIYLKYEEGPQNISLTTQYFSARESFSINVAPHNQFKCDTKKKRL